METITTIAIQTLRCTTKQTLWVGKLLYIKTEARIWGISQLIRIINIKPLRISIHQYSNKIVRKSCLITVILTKVTTMHQTQLMCIKMKVKVMISTWIRIYNWKIIWDLIPHILRLINLLQVLNNVAFSS